MEVLVGKISTFYTKDYRGSPVVGGGGGGYAAVT